MTSLLLSLVLACGTEDQAAKTLTDGHFVIALDPAHHSTVSVLRQLAHNPEDGRHFETTVEVYVLGLKLETDGDIHVVIADTPTGPTMIAEFPDPACAADSPKVVEMSNARADFMAIFGEPHAKFKRPKKPVRVRLTGAIYYDHPHGQLGRAPNSVELHPVVGVQLLQSTKTPPPSTGE